MPAGDDELARSIDEPTIIGSLDLLREQPFAALALVGLVAHHALREESSERLVETDIAAPRQRPHEEARVKQVKHGMLDAADVLIDRHPVIDRLAFESNGRTSRAKTQKIPGRIEEGVERVRLTAGRSAAMRATDMFPGRMVIERIARPIKADVARQFDREVLLGHRYDTASRAMNQRERASPISLPRYAPVAQPVGDCPLAAAECFEPPPGNLFRLGDRQAVEEGRIECGA